MPPRRLPSLPGSPHPSLPHQRRLVQRLPKGCAGAALPFSTVRAKGVYVSLSGYVIRAFAVAVLQERSHAQGVGLPADGRADTGYLKC